MSLEFFVLGYQKASFVNTPQSQQRVLCPRCVHVLCSVHTFNRQCQSAAGDSPPELSLFTYKDMLDHFPILLSRESWYVHGFLLGDPY